MKFNFLLAIILVITSYSCAKTPPQTIHPHGQTNEITQALEKELSQRDQNIQTLSAYAKVIIDDSQKILETEVAIVIQRTQQLRIEAMDSLADTWAIAGIDGEIIWLNLPQKNKSFRKKAKTEYLKKYLAADIDFTDLISIISGLIPDGHNLKLAELDRKNRHYRAFSEPIHIYYDTKRRLPQKLVKYSLNQDTVQEENGQIQYEVYFSNWKLVNTIYFPMLITLVSPKLGSQVIIEYQAVEINKPIEQKIFKSL
ncbi:MAG: DUF4292 domain-containing protein [Pseudomonadota bacterium]